MNYRCEYCGQKFALDDVCCRFCGGRLPDVAPQRNEIDFWPGGVMGSNYSIASCTPIIYEYHEDTRIFPGAPVLVDWRT